MNSRLDTSSADSRVSRTLEKGLRLLGLFDMEHQEWSLRELREQTGESKTTVLRLVRTLESLGYLSRDPENGTYHLGSSALKLAYVALSNSELLRVAKPLMRKLSEMTTETVDLTVEPEPGAVTLLAQVGSRVVRPHAPVGGLAHPGLTMAAGKIFWAFGPESRWDEVLSQSQARRTEHTITDVQLLRQQLAQVRREGIAYDLAEWNAELGTVAAPVFGQDGRVRACLTILVPIERFGAREMLDCAAAVKQIARELSLELGGTAKSSTETVSQAKTS